MDESVEVDAVEKEKPIAKVRLGFYAQHKMQYLDE